jgi:hypothetical protein
VSTRWRIALKLTWMAILIVFLILFTRVRYDFVYQGF